MFKTCARGTAAVKAESEHVQNLSGIARSRARGRWPIGYNELAVYTPTREEFVAAAARGQPDPGLSRAARRRRHAGLGLRGARRRRAQLPARVGGRRRDVGGVLVRRRGAARGRARGQAAPRGRPGTTSTAAARRAPPSGRRRSDRRARARCSARCARSTCRACRGSGAARSAGSRTTACARSRICRRARSRISICRRCAMVVTDTLLIFDNLRQTLKVVATPYVARPERAEAAYDRACARIDAIVATLRAPRTPLPELEPPRLGERARSTTPPSSFTRDEFVAAVDRVKEYILAGDAFQVVLSQRFAEPAAGARPLDVYRALRVINPSPYMFHLEFPEARVTGASPETLVRLSDGRVEVRPIAGTRPRGATAAEDERARGRAARRSEGARRAPDADRSRPQRRRPRRRGRQRARRRADGDRALLARHAPDVARRRQARAGQDAGSTCCAPRSRRARCRARRRSARWRSSTSSSRTSAASTAARSATSATPATSISRSRSARWSSRGDTIYVQAGAGLVADSVPELEYQECVNKARAVLRAVAMARTAREATSMNVLLIDNYDSFTYNLAQYLGELGAEVARRAQRRDHARRRSPRTAPGAIVISPGPCTPNEAGISMDVIRAFAGTMPILGVCLGHQCIGQVFGGRIVRAPTHHARQDLEDLPRREGAVRRASRTRSSRRATTRS